MLPLSACRVLACRVLARSFADEREWKARSPLTSKYGRGSGGTPYACSRALNFRVALSIQSDTRKRPCTFAAGPPHLISTHRRGEGSRASSSGANPTTARLLCLLAL